MPAADVWAFGIIAWEAVEEKEDIAGIAYEACIGGVLFGLLDIIYGFYMGCYGFGLRGSGV